MTISIKIENTSEVDPIYNEGADRHHARVVEISTVHRGKEYVHSVLHAGESAEFHLGGAAGKKTGERGNPEIVIREMNVPPPEGVEG